MAGRKRVTNGGLPTTFPGGAVGVFPSPMFPTFELCLCVCVCVFGRDATTEQGMMMMMMMMKQQIQKEFWANQASDSKVSLRLSVLF